MNVDEVCVVDITTESTCKKTLLKFHRHFAHPPAAKLTKLLQDANQWKPDFEPILNLYQSRAKFVNCIIVPHLDQSYGFHKQKISMKKLRWI